MPKSYIVGSREHQISIAHEQALAKLDRRELARKSDIDLAKWQSGFDSDEPQYRLAEHEWQRRITAQQIRASHIVAWVGVMGTLFGVLLGYWVSSKPAMQTDGKAATSTNQQQPVATPPKSFVVVPVEPVHTNLNPNEKHDK